MARTLAERHAALAHRPGAPKRRSERPRQFKETPSQRSLRGAQQVARHDMERGVTSRARKSFQGREDVADPRFGGRPGRSSSKWQPPRAERRPTPSAKTPVALHRVRVTLPEHLHAKLMDLVLAERSLRKDVRFSPSDKIAELVRDYELPPGLAALIGARRR